MEKALTLQVMLVHLHTTPFSYTTRSLLHKTMPIYYAHVYEAHSMRIIIIPSWQQNIPNTHYVLKAAIHVLVHNIGVIIIITVKQLYTSIALTELLY